MIDISGAGLSFGCSERIPENSPLKIRLQLSRFPHSEIITLARVVWTRPAESSTGRDTYEVGVFFDTILKDDREKIFRHIARIERKMLRERKETRDA
jgi:c-di-GMP-binding flagellar brake protein YcgR